MNQVPRQNSKQANVIADGNLLEIGGGEMTEREAIGIFKRANSGTVMEKTKQATALAIAALEKQIAKPPYQKMDAEYYCTRCDKPADSTKYCYNCGQRME